MTFFYDLNKKLDSIREKPETTHKQLNERDMSRAAKGYEKYGKEGMEALAKAGREGKSLDPIRNKYNKYDESVEEGSTGDYSAKKARAGKDIGKPGKGFAKIAKSAGERYGSKAAGERVAGAVLNKLRHPKEGIEDRIGDLDQSNPVNVPAYQRKAASGDSAAAARGMPKKEGVDKAAFAKLAPPKDKITFADKIAGAKKEVDEMLGDVAAEAIKGALSPKQKKIDMNKNGKLDANDFAMLRKGGKKKEVADEGWDDMIKDVERRRSTPKVGDVRHGAKHDVEEIPGGRRVTRRTDPNTGFSVGTDDDAPADGEKRGRGRPKGSKKSLGAKGPSGTSKLMKREGAVEENPNIAKAKAILKKAGYTVSKEGEEELDEKAVSKKQQRFMGMVHATQKGEKAPSKEVAKVAKTMKKKDAEDFASTKHKGLPEKKKPEAKKDDAPKKKQKTEEQGGTGTPTASSGFSFGKGIYDSLNRELEGMIAEGMNVSMNMNSDAHGGPTKSLTVTATDDDALKLGQLLKNAGLGGGDYPNVEGGADMDHPGAIEINGTMDAEGAEDLAAELRKAQHDHVDGNEECPTCGSTDCGCEQEEMDEAYGDNAVSDNQPDYTVDPVTSDNAMQYSGGLNKPKASGMATIPVTDVQVDGEDKFASGARVHGLREDEELARMMEMAGVKKKTDEEKTEEGNLFTGNLAKARAAGKKQADLDGDGDMEKVDEGILSATANLWTAYKGKYGV